MREEAQRLGAREVLAGIDLLAEGVEAGDGVGDVRPRVERRDVHAVAVDAHLDAVIDDGAEGRPAGLGSADVTQRKAAICTPTPRVLRRVSSSSVTSGTWCTHQRLSPIGNSLFTASQFSTTCCSPARFCTLFSLRQPAWATRRCASRHACPEPSGAAHSPIEPVCSMSSPKNSNELRRRSFSSGSSGSGWLCRKFICRRMVASPSRWS